MQFWDQVSLLSLLMLTEYTFIKMCVLFLCFCEGAFLHVMSRDTRLSALLVSRKRKIWVTTSLSYWWEPTWDVCWWTSVYTSRWPLAPSAGTDRGHAQVLLLLEDSAMCMGTGTLKSSRTVQAGTLRLPLLWRSWRCLPAACYRPHLPSPRGPVCAGAWAMLNNKQLQAFSEWACLSTLSEWCKALRPMCCEKGWTDEDEGLRGEGRKVPYLVRWATSCIVGTKNEIPTHWLLTPALCLPWVTSATLSSGSDAQAGGRRRGVAVLAGVAIESWVVEGRRRPPAFPTTLPEHRQGDTHQVVSESQNSDGCVTNVLLNFVRKNNPSFRLKEYFNLKCEYCHVIQIQS